jgi:hypothetical protein
MTDADGRAVWESAPRPDLQIAISAIGMTPVTNLPVQADGEEHIVTLTTASPARPSVVGQERTISGTVTDAATHQPIPRFRVVSGNPVNYPGGLTNIRWGIATFHSDGQFRSEGAIPLSVSAHYSVYCCKIEAEGYAPVVTRFILADEKDVSLDIALQPASSNIVTVLSPDGRPVTNADIGLEIPGTPLTLTPAGLWHPRSADYRDVYTTDSQGRAALPPDDTVVRVIAVSEEGYAEATPAALAAQPILRLQPWGRLEGDYLADGQPARGRSLVLDSAENRECLELDTMSYKAATGADGHFIFTNVPPGKVRLSSTNSSTNLEVHSGQTTTLTLRANR